MIRLAKSILPIAVSAALGLSLAACDRKPDEPKSPQAATAVDTAPAAAPAAPTATGETESEAGVGPEGGPPYGPRAGMERGREGREHGMRMAPDPTAPAAKPPE